jgi:hypothetical protein
MLQKEDKLKQTLAKNYYRTLNMLKNGASQ